jgi:hypothetical protein
LAAPAGGQGFAGVATLQPDQSMIRPQGLYKRNARRGQAAVEQARHELRGALGIPADCKVVICVGYADLRKEKFKDHWIAR